MHRSAAPRLRLPRQPPRRSTSAVSHAVLIEKLINFLKSSAVISANQTPVCPPGDQLYISPNDGGPAAWLRGNIWSFKVPFMEYCLIKVKLRELYAEFNFLPWMIVGKEKKTKTRVQLR